MIALLKSFHGIPHHKAKVSGLREAELNIMVTDICGATNCVIVEVGKVTMIKCRELLNLI